MSFITAFAAAVLLSQNPQVYVLRHGETTWNVQNKIQGQSNESQLTEKGREQVAEVMGRLLPLLKERQVEIWSSDLTRAHETAKIVAKALGISEDNSSRAASKRS